MTEETLKIEIVPALVSDRRCPDTSQPPHLLGSESFWCLTCNAYAEKCLDVEDGLVRDDSPF
jgi:hypothetical protein